MNELHPDWQKEAENVLNDYEYDNYSTRNGFYYDETVEKYGIAMATLMRDRVEKMLKDEIPNSKAQEPFIQYLINKLKSMTPND